MNQLAINLSLAPSYAAEDFIVSESNRFAYDMAMAWPNWHSHALWVYGPSASGKTHLAHIWAARAQAITITSTDMDALLGTPATAYYLDNTAIWQHEEFCFHLLNHVKQTQANLLICHDMPPVQLTLSLPDLRSRIQSLPSVGMQQPDDTLLRALMMKLCADRQIQLAPEVIDYALKRLDRSCAAIAGFIARIDQMALEQQRAITIPLVKQLLDEYYAS